jgi:hypothetical protein
MRLFEPTFPIWVESETDPGDAPDQANKKSVHTDPRRFKVDFASEALMGNDASP